LSAPDFCEAQAQHSFVTFVSVVELKPESHPVWSDEPTAEMASEISFMEKLALCNVS
jgi:hypothetical protein